MNLVPGDSLLTAGAPAAASEPVKVWLADDSENFRVLLAALLEDEGGIICERQFSCAEELLSALENNAGPDVILLDNRMPGMGGLAAINPIKLLVPATHIVMLTTFGDLETKACALKNGASDFLLKSFHVSDIANRIRQVILQPRKALRETIPSEPLAKISPGAENFPGRCANRSQAKTPVLRLRVVVLKISRQLDHRMKGIRAWTNSCFKPRQPELSDSKAR